MQTERMTIELINTALKILAAMAGLVSAAFWIISARTKEPYTGGAAITWQFEDGYHMDVAKTAMRQGQWNSRAAIAAALAAALAAVSLVLETTITLI